MSFIEKIQKKPEYNVMKWDGLSLRGFREGKIVAETLIAVSEAC
jgi:hypothetical protein